jgi:hypothetical protein
LVRERQIGLLVFVMVVSTMFMALMVFPALALITALMMFPTLTLITALMMFPTAALMMFPAIIRVPLTVKPIGVIISRPMVVIAVIFRINGTP